MMLIVNSVVESKIRISSELRVIPLSLVAVAIAVAVAVIVAVIVIMKMKLLCIRSYMKLFPRLRLVFLIMFC